MQRKSNKRGSRNPRKQRNEKPEIRKIEARLGMILPFEKIDVQRNKKWVPLKNPKGPMAGANFSTRQLASTFGTSSGLTNVGGSAGLGQLVQNGATAVNFAIAFELADLPQSSTFSSMFDQYRVERVKLHFRARSNAVSVFNVASPNSGVPSGYVVIDRDDATALSGITQAMEYDSVQCFTGEEDFSVELVPSITPAVFASGAFSGYGTQPSNALWLDIANTTVPCYGVKGSVGPLTATTTSSWVWDISAEYVVSFRKTR